MEWYHNFKWQSTNKSHESNKTLKKFELTFHLRIILRNKSDRSHKRCFKTTTLSSRSSSTSALSVTEYRRRWWHQRWWIANGEEWCEKRAHTRILNRYSAVSETYQEENAPIWNGNWTTAFHFTRRITNAHFVLQHKCVCNCVDHTRADHVSKVTTYELVVGESSKNCVRNFLLSTKPEGLWGLGTGTIEPYSHMSSLTFCSTQCSHLRRSIKALRIRNRRSFSIILLIHCLLQNQLIFSRLSNWLRTGFRRGLLWTKS
jgi:hypothetical protein